MWGEVVGDHTLLPCGLSLKFACCFLSRCSLLMRSCHDSIEISRINSQLQVEAVVELPDFKGGKDFYEKITRAKFEELCLDLFKKTLLPVDKVLQVR